MFRASPRIATSASALAVSAIAAVVLASPAAAVSGTHALKPSAKATVVKVHSDWDDDDRYERRRWRHRHRDVVDAPFTRVETGRRVVVDAPFAYVHVGRRGRHIVAPFVNLWIPR